MCIYIKRVYLTNSNLSLSKHQDFSEPEHTHVDNCMSGCSKGVLRSIIMFIGRCDNDIYL